MTQKEAIKKVYGIDDEKLLERISELHEDVVNALDNNWSTLFILDILYYIMSYSNIIDLINLNIDEKDKDNFSKRVEVFLDIVPTSEIISMVSKFLGVETKTRRK